MMMMVKTPTWSRPFNRSVNFELDINTYLVVVATLLFTFAVSNLPFSLNKLLKTYRHVCELIRGCCSSETKTIFTNFFIYSRKGVGLLKWIVLQLNFGIV
jgi:hypothetical protein